MPTTRIQEPGGPGTLPGARPGDAGLIVRQRRHRGRQFASAVVVLLGVYVLISVATNERFGWGVVADHLFNPVILAGLRSTLLLTLYSTLIGLGLGAVIAVMRLSPIRVLWVPAWLFALFFRGTPLLVQVIFWYNLAALYPTVSLGIPGIGTLYQGDVNTLITPIAAGLLALGLNEAAYMSEIIRAGIIGVDKGQVEAAKSLGMRPMRVLRRVVFPQAMRTIIPPTGNEVIGLLKSTSLVSVIAVPELLFSAQVIYAQNLETIPLLVVVSIWYMVITTIMSVGQFYLERRYGRGSGRDAPRSLFQIIGTSLTRSHAPRPTTSEGAPS
ncbi:amino acid ABC transporter permease [Streptomyces sp. NPDC002523]